MMDWAIITSSQCLLVTTVTATSRTRTARPNGLHTAGLSAALIHFQTAIQRKCGSLAAQEHGLDTTSSAKVACMVRRAELLEATLGARLAGSSTRTVRPGCSSAAALCCAAQGQSKRPPHRPICHGMTDDHVAMQCVRSNDVHHIAAASIRPSARQCFPHEPTIPAGIYLSNHA